jgi:hypothetical protein
VTDTRELNKILQSLERSTSSVILDQSRYGYDDAKNIFNRAIQRTPSAIIRLRSCSDIEVTVRALSQAGVRFTLRGGGHSIAGTCIDEGAVMLDMSLLRRVLVDPSTQEARVEPGALWCDYDAATTRHELASTGGIVSHTGVAGLTLGGGLGWLMGLAGLACDSLVGLTVINGACETVEVDEQHEALRLFRGAGRSLGVVTELRFRPRQCGSTVTSGRAVYDFEAAAELLVECSQAAFDSPDWLTVSPSLIWRDGQWSAVLDFVSTESLVTTNAALKRSFSAAKSLNADRMPYVSAQKRLDSILRFGRRNYWKSLALRDISSNIAAALVDDIQAAPSRQTFLSIDVLHGSSLLEPSGGSSYALRDLPLVVLFNTIWEDSEGDEANRSWCRNASDRLSEMSGSHATYSNYFSEDDVATQPGSSPQLSKEAVAEWTPAGLR